MTLKTIKQYLSKKRKEIIMFRFYLKRFSLKQPQKKQIIVCFDGLFPHGGLVDRLKGIVSFYQIAQELDYDFKITFNNPFHLKTFLEPNKVKWDSSLDALLWHPTKTKLLYLVNNFEANPLQIIKKSKAKQFYVYANIDYSKKTFSNLNQEELEEKWHNDFNVLFKKSELLKGKLATWSSEPYIAFHSRFTSLMGDFKDATTKILPKAEKEDLNRTLLKLINKVKIKQNLKAFVFSDSISFIEYVKENTEVNVVSGNPFHMDNFNERDDLDGHLKTLIDFFMISKSEKVYFLNVKPMYNSSFSKYAAIVGRVKFQVLEA